MIALLGSSVSVIKNIILLSTESPSREYIFISCGIYIYIIIIYKFIK